MTVANIFVFSLGFLAACLLGLIVARMVWVRAVRLTRTRLERDRPETLRAFEARIAGAQARAAVSIRELERTLDRERQISAQARLLADQMTSSTAIASAERDDTQSALVNLSETLEQTRDRLREHEEALTRRNTDIANLRRDLSDVRQELAMRGEDVRRAESEADALRAELAAQLAGDQDPRDLAEIAKTEGSSAVARAQIETLREELRTLRAEKNAAEASATRARLLLEARDEDGPSKDTSADFDAERNELLERIATLEADAKRPRLVSISSQEADQDDNPQALEALRQSIDAMTASLTAAAAVESDASSKINTLLDEAADQAETDGGLVTSLVEARERLRAKTNTASQPNEPSGAEISKAAVRQAAAKLAARNSAKTANAGSKTTKASATKIKATAASGKPKKTKSTVKPAEEGTETATSNGRSRSALPRASENDLKVI